jgi:Polyketide cyclase / dehydrase and lipid transport
MVRLLEKRFSARVAVSAAWEHLARVESWPSWAKHIRRVELRPAGPLGPVSAGTIHLSNGIRSTFRMTQWSPGANWKWTGPFLWLTVDYDHRFRELGPSETEITFIVEGEGLGVSLLGPVFAFIYQRSLERAIPALVAELEAR